MFKEKIIIEMKEVFKEIPFGIEHVLKIIYIYYDHCLNIICALKMLVIIGKELMTQDEIAVMDGGKCILQLRGVRPFLSDKYDITKHPNYKYLSDFDKKNAFDVERYMSTRPAIVKPDEAFDIYEIDLSDEDAAAEE